MEWVALGLTIATFVYSLYQQSKTKGAPAQTLQYAEIPTASEGVAVPVVFGSALVTAPNVTWFGDNGLDNNSGLSYAYSHPLDGQLYYKASMQIGICCGMLDAILDVYSGGKSCLVGLMLDSAHTGPQNQVDLYCTNFIMNLGATNNAGVDAGVADYLAGAMGLPAADGGPPGLGPGNRPSIGPKYYGVANVVLINALLGTQPNMKPLTFAAKRIHTRDCGATAQWYDAKSEIPRASRSRMDNWKYQVQTMSVGDLYSTIGYDDGLWPQGPGGFGNNFLHVDQSNMSSGLGTADYTTIPQAGVYTWLQAADWPGYVIGDGTYNGFFSVATGTKVWIRWHWAVLPGYPLNVQCWHDGSGRLWFNGNPITLYPAYPNLTKEHYKSTATIPASMINTGGDNVISFCVTAGIKPDGTPCSNSFVYAGLQVGEDSEFPAGIANMNPVHMIHDALTDKDWGTIRCNDADIDETSFRAAADYLHDVEGFGLSTLWSREGSSEDFINEILRHISAALYISRTTGLWTIKLLRNDYYIPGLVVLDESNIVKMENAGRKQIGESINSVTATFTSTIKGDQGSLTMQDDALIASQGGIVSQKIDYPMITSPIDASKVLMRDLRALSSPIFVADIECGRQAADLNPGDAFVCNWPDLQVYSLVMRVIGIDLGDGLNNMIKIKASEDVFFMPKEASHIPPAQVPKVQPRLPAPTLTGDTYQTMLTYDPRNKGAVECLYTSGSSELGMFDPGEWTEWPPGTFTRNTAGPLTTVFFDGIDPGATSTTGSSWLLGKTVLGCKPWQVGPPGLSDAGLFIVDDVGAHWYHYGLPDQAYITTHAKLHRDPRYLNSADFVNGMVFISQQGVTYGGHYIQLATPNIVVGTTGQHWTDQGTTFAFSNPYNLVRSDQIAGLTYSRDSMLQQTVTSVGSDFPHGFAMLAGTPGVSSIPAGPWVVTPGNVTLSGGDVGAVTSIGFKIFQSGGTTPGVLFELISSPLVAGLQLVQPLTYSAPQIPVDMTGVLVLIPTVHTTSATPVTLSMSYSGGATVRVRIPCDATTRRTAQLQGIGNITSLPDEAWLDSTGT
jgi:hypothetical protein